MKSTKTGLRMNTNLNQEWYPNLVDAWKGINEHLLTKEHELLEKGWAATGPQIFAFNNHIFIESLDFDPDFDFGKILGYSDKKWSGLINNYVDFDYLDMIKNEIQLREEKKAKSYNYSYHFVNVHGSGKDCLISLTFTKRAYCENPIVVFHIRTSEVTKRLPFDFLLVKRICQYIYGEDKHIHCEFVAPSYYITSESILMYDNVKSIKKLLRRVKKKKGSLGKFQQRVLMVYDKFLTTPLDEITYQVNRRSAAQIQKDENGEPLSGVKSLKAKELWLYDKSTIYPVDCISPKARFQYRKELRQAEK
tara:strand:+ start:7071 stop:7988 length:918 start_codon:yes stop_codon:yes gene_type:complete